MTKEILTFKIDNEVYGIDISDVTEIIRADYHITPVPKSGPEVIGIFQPRDRVVNAIDLKYALYKQPNKTVISLGENGHDRYYILCSTKAWYVDMVLDIISFEESEIISPSSVTKGKNSFITGIYKTEDGELIQIIDFSLINKES